MKKTLLLFLGSLMAANVASADQCYIYHDVDGFPLQGAARRVSPNGQWVVGGDDIDETGSYIINTESPADYIFTDEGLLLDINNDGLAVGSWFRKEGYAKYYEAAYYKDGVWVRLPLPEEIIGQSTAVAVSEDSKLIAGHAMCANENPDEPGKNFPITWKYNEATGEYEILKLYNGLSLPGTYGFYMQDMTPSATHVCGFMGLNMGDNIGVVLNLATGELKTFHNLETRLTWFEIIDPKTGADKSGYFPTQYVDDLMDGFNESVRFAGGFYYATDNYIFGSRDIVSDVKEDGSGKITTISAIYDIANDKFIDGKEGYFYVCGENPDLQFTSTGDYIYHGAKFSINEDFGNGKTNVQAIYSMNDRGDVLTGSYLFTTPIGDIMESPVVLLLDKGLSGIQEVGLDPEFSAQVTVTDRRITVTGAKEVSIFSLNGSILTKGNSVDASPGVYIVIADGKSAKVIVK